MGRLLLLALLLLPAAARADEAEAWAALRAGGHVAMMRHTEAPGGAGDPPGFRLDDCATQRNLSEKGRDDARAAGARLKAEGIAIARLVSSPWCRCLDTARLLDLGPVAVEDYFSNAFVLTEQRDSLVAGPRAIIAAWTGPGTYFAVTHGANIYALTGLNPPQGTIVVVEPTASGTVRIIGAIPQPE